LLWQWSKEKTINLSLFEALCEWVSQEFNNKKGDWGISDGILKVSKGKSVDSSKVRSIDRNDPDWYRIYDGDTFNRTVWLHESMQNNER
jgi:hypothetical protein